MKLVKAHIFNGVKFDIDLGQRPIKGLLIPHGCYGDICIMRPLNTRMGLDTAIHEATHALCPELKEADVGKFATEMAKWLWRLGYRTDYPMPPKPNVKGTK